MTINSYDLLIGLAESNIRDLEQEFHAAAEDARKNKPLTVEQMGDFLFRYQTAHSNLAEAKFGQMMFNLVDTGVSIQS